VPAVPFPPHIELHIPTTPKIGVMMNIMGKKTTQPTITRGINTGDMSNNTPPTRNTRKKVIGTQSKEDHPPLEEVISLI